MQKEQYKPGTVKAWDPLIRLFHWSLVVFFALAYLTEDDWLQLHVFAGYTVAMLIAFRLVWGVIGTRTARFTTFIKRPAIVKAHLRRMLSGKPPHYLGHNPVAAVMVVSLLVSLGLTTFTGLILIAGEGAGPLANTMFSAWSGGWMEEMHEFFAGFTLFLVFLHVGGVVLSSLLEGENLARAMITGHKRKRADWQDTDEQELSATELNLS